MADNLLKLPLSPHFTVHFPAVRRHRRVHPLSPLRHRSPQLFIPLNHWQRPNLIISKAVEISKSIENFEPQEGGKWSDSPILLDVAGMMCGACVSRVKSILSADERVKSAVVNMVTETAAIQLNPLAVEGELVDDAAESLAQRLTECGFEAKRRVSGKGVGEKVRKWKEMEAKKEALLQRSRNRVVFAWTLVALCCGSHASHILHSLGIHIAHGGVWDWLHSTYVKGFLALTALLGPGRELTLPGQMTLNYLSNAERTEEAASYLAEMMARGLKLDAFTYSPFIHAYSKDGEMKIASTYYNEMLDCGIAPNDVSYTNLVDACST